MLVLLLPPDAGELFSFSPILKLFSCCLPRPCMDQGRQLILIGVYSCCWKLQITMAPWLVGQMRNSSSPKICEPIGDGPIILLLCCSFESGLIGATHRRRGVFVMSVNSCSHSSILGTNTVLLLSSCFLTGSTSIDEIQLFHRRQDANGVSRGILGSVAMMICL